MRIRHLRRVRSFRDDGLPVCALRRAGRNGLRRLTGAHWKTSAGASIYAYDKVGNRRHIVENGTPTYYAYNAANELLHEVTPGGEIAYYTHDGRGNQTQRKVLGGHTHYFEYNSRNLIAVSVPVTPLTCKLSPRKALCSGMSKAGSRWHSLPGPSGVLPCVIRPSCYTDTGASVERRPLGLGVFAFGPRLSDPRRRR